MNIFFGIGANSWGFTKGKDYFAAVVDSSSILRFRRIDIADNDGKVIQIATGLSAGDRIALGIGDALKDGDKVQVITPPPVSVGPGK